MKDLRVSLATMSVLALSWSAWAGDISGSITLETPTPPRRHGEVRDTTNYGDKGDVPSPSEQEVENVVLYLEGGNLPCTPLTKASSKNTVMQRNKEFIPHVLPVTKGSKVYFKNRDPYPHHVYSVSNPGSFEIVKHGSAVRSQGFEASGEVEIFCGIHTKMNAYLLVLDNDFYCTPNAQGRYRLAAVPPGQYTLVVWRPLMTKPDKRSITVPASGVLKLDIKI